MVNGIGHPHKPSKQNRQQPGVINVPLNTNSSTPNRHNKFNEKLMYLVNNQ